jgi:hypothetical protein
MLHLYLVQKNILASSVNIRIEKERAWDGTEQEYIQKDKEQKEDLKPL